MLRTSTPSHKNHNGHHSSSVNKKTDQTHKISKPGEKMSLADREVRFEITRKQGFISFIIPTAIIILMIINSEILSFGKIWSEIFNDQAIRKTVQYFAIWFVVEVFLNTFKFILCVPFYGMSLDHYKLIIGPRHNWTDQEYKELKKYHSGRKLKIIDAIYRRAGHILVNFWRIYYYTVLVQDTYLRLQVAILQLPVIFTIKKCTEFNVIGNFVFQGCRIRDGQYT